MEAIQLDILLTWPLGAYYAPKTLSARMLSASTMIGETSYKYTKIHDSEPEGSKMGEDKSQIHSMSINLGTSSSGNQARAIEASEPWTILVCGDFGYTSKKPQRISAGQFADFLQQCPVLLSGSVEKNLPAAIPSFFVEYRVSSMQDFALNQVIAKSPVASALVEAAGILEQLQAGRIEKRNALSALSDVGLPTSISAMLTNFLGSAVRPRANESEVDSILSMLDLGENSSSMADASTHTTPVDYLAKAALGASHTEFPGKDISDIIEQLRQLAQAAAQAIMGQSFFGSAWSSWTALRQFLKTVGRKKEITVLIFSMKSENAASLFPETLASSREEAATPDIVLWDYKVNLTAASVHELESIAAQTEQHKASLISSIPGSAQEIAEMAGADTIRPILDQPQWIPLKRLRSKEISRCVTLCSPDLIFEKSKGKGLSAGGAWILMNQWARALVDGDSPFGFDGLELHRFKNSSASVPPELSAKFDDHALEEAAKSGIALASIKDGAVWFASIPTLLVEQENAEVYSHFGFNLLVNRAARLAAEWISRSGTSADALEAAAALQQFLFAQLRPYHILSSGSDLVVRATSGLMTIDLHSDETIAGSPVRFQFTLSYP